MSDYPTRTASQRRVRAHRMILLVIVSVLAVSLLVWWMNRGRMSPVYWTDIERQSGTPTWQGLIPGQTSKQEVIKELGIPRRVQTRDDIELLFYGRHPLCDEDYEVCHRVTLQDDTVATILLFFSDTSSSTHPISFADIIAEFGPPSHVEENTLLYPDLGLTFVLYEERIPPRVNREIVEGTYTQSSRQLEEDDLSNNTIIDYVMLYAPVSMVEYEETWGRFHPLDNPWDSKVPRRVDQVEIVPGVTTKEQVVDVLGEPDIEGFALQFCQRYMIYRLPGWKDEYVLRVFLNLAGTVQILSGPVPVERPYRLKEVILSHGIPDLIESPPVGDNVPVSPIHLIMWQDEGLIYRVVKAPRDTSCLPSSRSLPSELNPCAGPDDIVTAFRRVIPGPATGSEILYLPQFEWSP